MKIGDDVCEVKRFEAIRVAPGAIRNFEAGPDGIEILAFGADVSVGNDSEILQGWWSE